MTLSELAAEIILHRLRRSREDFLDQHSDAIYRKLTKDHEEFLRVDELCYEAAKLVPGLVPTRKQVDAESRLMQGDKDGA